MSQRKESRPKNTSTHHSRDSSSKSSSRHLQDPRNKGSRSRDPTPQGRGQQDHYRQSSAERTAGNVRHEYKEQSTRSRDPTPQGRGQQDRYRQSSVERTAGNVRHEYKEQSSRSRDTSARQSDVHGDSVLSSRHSLTRDSSHDRSFEQRRNESNQSVSQSTERPSRSRSRSTNERNKLPKTSNPTPKRNVFGPQLRDLEDDYSPSRTSNLPPNRNVFGPQLRDLEDDYSPSRTSNSPPSRNVFGPQLRDVEEDYISARSQFRDSRKLQSSNSQNQRPVGHKKKTLPQLPHEHDSRQCKGSTDLQSSYSPDSSYKNSSRYRDRNQTRDSLLHEQDNVISDNVHYRSRDQMIQKVVEELQTKGIGKDYRHLSRNQHSRGDSRGLRDLHDSRDYSPQLVNETSQLRDAVPLRSGYPVHAGPTDYQHYSSSDNSPQKPHRSGEYRDSRDVYDSSYSSPGQIRKPGAHLMPGSNSKDGSGQRSMDMEERHRRFQSPDRSSGSSSRRTSRSRDHTPQRRFETPRSRDRTPDPLSNKSNSREDLRAVRGHHSSVSHRRSSPSLEKGKNKNNLRDGKSRESLTSLGGEKKSVRPGAPSEPNEYNFNYKRRGLFIIINNKNFHPDTGQQTREGTDVDAERLEERFQDLGFEVKRYDDVTRSKMSRLMYEAAACDHSDADCFGCAILSHGLEGRVYGTDGYLTLEVMVMPFKGDKCPTLVGKPKLFFLQACRGTKMDYGVDVSDSSISSRDEEETDGSNTVSIRKIPIEADFLFAYSTVPGYYSWRNNQDGSWFIQALCIVLENYGLKMELLHMLTHVNRIVAYEFASCSDREFTDKMKQMPCVVSMLTRYVYFRHKKQDIR